MLSKEIRKEGQKPDTSAHIFRAGMLTPRVLSNALGNPGNAANLLLLELEPRVKDGVLELGDGQDSVHCDKTG